MKVSAIIFTASLLAASLEKVHSETAEGVVVSLDEILSEPTGSIRGRAGRRGDRHKEEEEEDVSVEKTDAHTGTNEEKKKKKQERKQHTAEDTESPEEDASKRRGHTKETDEADKSEGKRGDNSSTGDSEVNEIEKRGRRGGGNNNDDTESVRDRRRNNNDAGKREGVRNRAQDKEKDDEEKSQENNNDNQKRGGNRARMQDKEEEEEKDNESSGRNNGRNKRGNTRNQDADGNTESKEKEAKHGGRDRKKVEKTGRKFRKRLGDIKPEQKVKQKKHQQMMNDAGGLGDLNVNNMVVNSQEIEQSEVTFSEETAAATEESSIEVRSESEVNGKSQKEPPKEEEEEEEVVTTVAVEEVLATHTTDASTYADENSTTKRKERHEKIRHKRREDPQSFEVERFGVPPPSVVEHSSNNEPQFDAKSKKEAPHEEPATAVEQVTAVHATDIETHNDGTSSKRKERYVKIRHQRRQEPPEPSTFTGQRFGVPSSVIQVSSSEPQPHAKSHKEHP